MMKRLFLLFVLLGLCCSQVVFAQDYNELEAPPLVLEDSDVEELDDSTDDLDEEAKIISEESLAKSTETTSVHITPSPVVVRAGQTVQLKALLQKTIQEKGMLQTTVLEQNDPRFAEHYTFEWNLHRPDHMGGFDWGTLSAKDGEYTAPLYPPPGPVTIVVHLLEGMWATPVAYDAVLVIFDDKEASELDNMPPETSASKDSR